jgi:hypothetical protein
MESYFKELKNLQTFPNIIDYLPNLESFWKNNDQICLNTTIGHPDDYTYGVGSLPVPDNLSEFLTKDERLKEITTYQRFLESEFTEFNPRFANTPLEEIYSFIKSNFNVGRVRLMRISPRKTMSWHYDTTQRLHYPIETYTGCRMVIENESAHLPADTWWITNTINNHTAFNASNKYRIHLVACLL